MRFNGPDYTPSLDKKRLTKQHEVIKDLMLNGPWRTLQEIHLLTGFPESSISAQLRHLRKDRFGGYRVDKRRKGDRMSGLFEYSIKEGLKDGEQVELFA